MLKCSFLSFPLLSKETVCVFSLLARSNMRELCVSVILFYFVATVVVVTAGAANADAVCVVEAIFKRNSLRVISYP